MRVSGCFRLGTSCPGQLQTGCRGWSSIDVHFAYPTNYVTDLSWGAVCGPCFLLGGAEYEVPARAGTVAACWLPEKAFGKVE